MGCGRHVRTVSDFPIFAKISIFSIGYDYRSTTAPDFTILLFDLQLYCSYVKNYFQKIDAAKSPG